MIHFKNEYKMKQLSGFMILIAVITLNSCSRYKCISGSGRIITKEFSAADFTGIISYGDFDVYIDQNDSDYFEVSVDADENFMPYVDVVRNNGRLELKTINDRCFKNGDPVVVHIKMPEVLYVNLAGSGTITANCNGYHNATQTVLHSGSGIIDMYGIYTDYLTTSLTGSGDIVLDGSTINHDILLSGSGKIKAYNLDSNQCKVDLPGSGYVQVFVYDFLNVDISGSGSVYYQGSPDINYRITGSGSIYHR